MLKMMDWNLAARLMTTHSVVTEQENFFVPSGVQSVEDQILSKARPGHLCDGIDCSIVQDNQAKHKGKRIIRQWEKYQMAR
jgi:hypothetical protein